MRAASLPRCAAAFSPLRPTWRSVPRVNNPSSNTFFCWVPSLSPFWCKYIGQPSAFPAAKEAAAAKVVAKARPTYELTISISVDDAGVCSVNVLLDGKTLAQCASDRTAAEAERAECQAAREAEQHRRRNANQAARDAVDAVEQRRGSNTRKQYAAAPR